jgi:hypothetical protein
MPSPHIFKSRLDEKRNKTSSALFNFQHILMTPIALPAAAGGWKSGLSAQNFSLIQLLAMQYGK